MRDDQRTRWKQKDQPTSQYTGRKSRLLLCFLEWHLILPSTEPKLFNSVPEEMSDPTEDLTNKPFTAQLSNVYLSILALFCFKLFVKISLNLLTYFYIVRGNRKEAARISAEFYDYGQQHSSWADRSPLHDAASQGRLLALRTLILQGHNVNVLTIDHVTPLHEACLGDHVACARALIDAGANVNASTIDGATPLFNACSVGSVACAEILLENGAKPQSLVYHPSPIHEATSKGHYGCVEALVTWGADVDMDIPHLGTALYTACVCQELECARKLLREGANVQKGKSLDSPLHAAAEKDHTAVVKLLLDFGADINARNTECQRPVDVAPPSSLTEGFLLLYEATPRLLSQLCRQCIRSCVGRDRLHLLSHLPLPNRLRSYLQYQ
ncbi:ankyrin repeat and SOCS box protein 5 [Echeneis naucrates]|uniref:SOCS box domain-containing protein n=1 Tax=Echeneis naucrates TaxID=173247 RepID=A0A665VM41_ECHNA|nr:ankyrin repeat and SOCS box protein 5 [Echeneis naucrates]